MVMEVMIMGKEELHYYDILVMISRFWAIGRCRKYQRSRVANIQRYMVTSTSVRTPEYVV